jgi:hypothetical protein
MRKYDFTMLDLISLGIAISARMDVTLEEFENPDTGKLDCRITCGGVLSELIDAGKMIMTPELMGFLSDVFAANV